MNEISSELLERVARAIGEARRGDKYPDGIWAEMWQQAHEPCGNPCLDATSWRVCFIDEARAAINVSSKKAT